MTTPKTAFITGITDQTALHSQRGRSAHRRHPCKAVNYREAYGMYACNGILFNHESPRRGETFVTRKIPRGLANISQGLEDCLFMGNIDALRDWGHAKDYVRIDPRYFRPTEVETLLGDPAKAKQKLGWVPEITLDELVQEMVATDLADAKKKTKTCTAQKAWLQRQCEC